MLLICPSSDAISDQLTNTGEKECGSKAWQFIIPTVEIPIAENPESSESWT